MDLADDGLFLRPRVTRRQYLIESLGYPVGPWLRIVVDESNFTTDVIVQIDMYADEACTMLLVDDLGLDDFTTEQAINIGHSLHAKQCAEADRRHFARMIDRAQAALR